MTSTSLLEQTFVLPWGTPDTVGFFPTDVSKPLTVDLVFSVNRGRPLGFLRTGSSGLDLDRKAGRAPPPNVLRIPILPPAPEGRLVVKVAARLEPAELVKYVVRGPDGEALAVLAPNRCDGSLRVFDRDSPDWQDVSNSVDPSGYLDSLDQELDNPAYAGDDKTTPRKFFRDLDSKTNDILLDELVARGEIYVEDADQRRLAVESVFYELCERVQRRCNGLTPAGSYPLLDDRLFSHLEPKCQDISDLLLSIVDEHFGNDVDAFERAFTLFANGQLRLELPSLVLSCQPSSGYYFLFGELALMAIDFNISRSRWQTLANVLVRTQRIYTRVYAPADKAGATYLSYRSTNYACHNAPYTQPDIDALKAEFVGKDLFLEAARHAHDEMPGLLRP